MNEFIDAAISIGVEIDNPTETTRQSPTRVRLIGNGNAKDGWYYLNIINGHAIGVIGNWKTGEKTEVKSSGGFDGISKAELAALKLIRQAAKEEQKRVQKEASVSAIEYIESLPECPGDHPYLITKGINSTWAKFDEEDGALVVPLTTGSRITSWQKIWDISSPEEKEKDF